MKNKKWLNDLIAIQSSGVSSDRLVTSSRTWLEVADVMSKDVATAWPDEKVVSAAKMMSEKKISCIVIMDNGSVAGILTETDMLRRVVSKGKDFYQTKLRQIMSWPVESVPYDLSVLDASEIMSEKHIKRLPILEEGKLVGIVTQTDLVRALTSYGLWRDVSEIMSLDVAGIQSNASVAEAAEAMTSRKISCIAVLDGDEVAGVLTEKDLLGRVVALERDPARVKMVEVMSYPVTSIPPHYSIFSASKIMEEMNIRRLVVIKDKQVCGVVTQTDIFMAVRNKLQAEEEKNFRLLEESKSNIYTSDLDGMITYVNLAFMKLLEVSDPAELIGQAFLPNRFWFNLEERKQFLRELKNGSIESKNLALKTSKGKKIYVTVFPRLTKDIHGEINGSQGIVYDITAKKELVALRKAEEALQQSEERLRIILNSILTGVVLIDAESHEIIDANPLAAELIGLPKKEIVGNLCHEFICPAVQGNCPISDLGQTVDQSERMLLRADGKKVPIIKTVTPTTWQGRKYFVESFIDITWRKKAEEQIKELSSAVEQSIDGIAIADLEMKLTYLNDAFAQMHGYSPEEMVGMKVVNLHNKEQIDEYNRRMNQIKTQGSWMGEIGHIRKDGTPFPTHMSVTPLRDDNGKPAGSLAVTRDITERKQAEEALRESERKYSDLVQQSPDAIISLDKTGNFLSFNPAAERISGFSAQEVLSRHFTKVGILAKVSIPKTLKEFGLVLSGAERLPFELIVTRKDKSRLFMEANGRLIKHKGREKWIQVILRDITKRKKVEQALEGLNKDLESAVRELTRANKELQEFAYIAAHDLKTPLRGIGTLADWLSKDYADKFDEQGQKQVRLIVGKAKQMSALIDDILQYSRVGQNDPKKQQVDLNTVLSEAISRIEPPENIEITVENELPALTCEKTQIIQVFQNLLGNAIKYMDKPKGQIKVGCVQEDGFWKFSVADNGPGIEQKYFKKIFKIFQTLSPTDRVDSTGIGLSIVKKITELNGGRVWVESKPDEGSTFFFTLPK
ncbi:MAG: PAS domain S-box protein [Planctomycetota bacterium]